MDQKALHGWVSQPFGFPNVCLLQVTLRQFRMLRKALSSPEFEESAQLRAATHRVLDSSPEFSSATVCCKAFY